ncbi:hypothetical protein R3P38DRAFT_3465478 [Favolaschia claudopus]|uniref:Uncharacterized protein n=1 Tax=Favolaschia claudopus TaxID=2862362 RepID=A0AAV9ZFV7_9AGAR
MNRRIIASVDPMTCRSVGGRGGEGGSSFNGSAGGGGFGEGPRVNHNQFHHYYFSPRPATPPVQHNLPQMCHRDIYCSEMLLQKRGYPVFYPEVQFHAQGRGSRIAIGDIGSFTREGLFESYFNIFHSAQHPANTQCPPGFAPMTKADGTPSIVTATHSAVTSGDYLASSTVQREFGDDFRKFIFHCSGPSGAILALPNGSRGEDLLIHIRPYVMAHAENWYSHITRVLCREIVNEELILVTGHDVADSWGMAYYSAPPSGSNPDFILRFEKPSEEALYRWAGVHGQAHSSHYKAAGDSQEYVVFLRGRSITFPSKRSEGQPSVAISNWPVYTPALLESDP